MKLNNRQFGEIELPEDSIYHFPHGLLGFEDHKRFAFAAIEEYAPFHWLLCVDEPNLCFPLLAPVLLHPDYRVPVGNVERSALESGPEDLLLAMAIVTIGGARSAPSVNLRGPVLLNPKSRKGMQVVLFESTYSVKAEIPLISAAPAVP